MKKIFSLILVIAFLTTSVIPPSMAQSVLLPTPGTVVNVTSTFSPILMRGVMIHPEDSLKFDFIIDKGSNPLASKAFNQEANKLIKYFLASLTIPEKEMWVNLSPYEKDRIIPSAFGQTEMGRDLLAQDYMLKQLTASLLMPEGEVGKKFWERVHAQAKEKFGTTEVPMDTFNKIWIIPENAKVYENEKGAFVVGTHLKVLLEEDYIALEANQNSTEHGLGNVKKEDLKPITKLQTEILREVIIPEIEREVNEGETFANLRQIYYSMVLASWYKQALKESLLGKIYVDKSKTEGVNVQDPKDIEKIYDQYVDAFKKGVAGIIKEDYDASAQEVVSRKYVTGGMLLKGNRSALSEKEKREAGAAMTATGGDMAMVTTKINEMGRSPDAAMLADPNVLRFVEEQKGKGDFSRRFADLDLLLDFLKGLSAEYYPDFLEMLSKLGDVYDRRVSKLTVSQSQFAFDVDFFRAFIGSKINLLGMEQIADLDANFQTSPGPIDKSLMKTYVILLLTKESEPEALNRKLDAFIKLWGNLTRRAVEDIINSDAAMMTIGQNAFERVIAQARNTFPSSKLEITGDESKWSMDTVKGALTLATKNGTWYVEAREGLSLKSSMRWRSEAKTFTIFFDDFPDILSVNSDRDPMGGVYFQKPGFGKGGYGSIYALDDELVDRIRSEFLRLGIRTPVIIERIQDAYHQQRNDAGTNDASDVFIMKKSKFDTDPDRFTDAAMTAGEYFAFLPFRIEKALHDLLSTADQDDRTVRIYFGKDIVGSMKLGELKESERLYSEGLSLIGPDEIEGLRDQYGVTALARASSKTIGESLKTQGLHPNLYVYRIASARDELAIHIEPAGHQTRNLDIYGLVDTVLKANAEIIADLGDNIKVYGMDVYTRSYYKDLKPEVLFNYLYNEIFHGANEQVKMAAWHRFIDVYFILQRDIDKTNISHDAAVKYLKTLIVQNEKVADTRTFISDEDLVKITNSQKPVELYNLSNFGRFRITQKDAIEKLKAANAGILGARQATAQYPENWKLTDLDKLVPLLQEANGDGVVLAELLSGPAGTNTFLNIDIPLQAMIRTGLVEAIDAAMTVNKPGTKEYAVSVVDGRLDKAMIATSGEAKTIQADGVTDLIVTYGSQRTKKINLGKLFRGISVTYIVSPNKEAIVFIIPQISAEGALSILLRTQFADSPDFKDLVLDKAKWSTKDSLRIEFSQNGEGLVVSYKTDRRNGDRIQSRLKGEKEFTLAGENLNFSEVWLSDDGTSLIAGYYHTVYWERIGDVYLSNALGRRTGLQPVLFLENDSRFLGIDSVDFTNPEKPFVKHTLGEDSRSIRKILVDLTKGKALEDAAMFSSAEQRVETIRAIDDLLEKFGKELRIVPFDRSIPYSRLSLILEYSSASPITEMEKRLLGLVSSKFQLNLTTHDNNYFLYRKNLLKQFSDSEETLRGIGEQINLFLFELKQKLIEVNQHPDAAMLGGVKGQLDRTNKNKIIEIIERLGVAGELSTVDHLKTFLAYPDFEVRQATRRALALIENNSGESLGILSQETIENVLSQIRSKLPEEYAQDEIITYRHIEEAHALLEKEKDFRVQTNPLLAHEIFDVPVEISIHSVNDQAFDPRTNEVDVRKDQAMSSQPGLNTVAVVILERLGVPISLYDIHLKLDGWLISDSQKEAFLRQLLAAQPDKYGKTEDGGYYFKGTPSQAREESEKIYEFSKAKPGSDAAMLGNPSLTRRRVLAGLGGFMLGYLGSSIFKRSSEIERAAFERWVISKNGRAFSEVVDQYFDFDRRIQNLVKKKNILFSLTNYEQNVVEAVSAWVETGYSVEEFFGVYERNLDAVKGTKVDQLRAAADLTRMSSRFPEAYSKLVEDIQRINRNELGVLKKDLDDFIFTASETGKDIVSIRDAKIEGGKKMLDLLDWASEADLRILTVLQLKSNDSWEKILGIYKDFYQWVSEKLKNRSDDTNVSAIAARLTQAYYSPGPNQYSQERIKSLFEKIGDIRLLNPEHFPEEIITGLISFAASEKGDPKEVSQIYLNAVKLSQVPESPIKPLQPEELFGLALAAYMKANRSDAAMLGRGVARVLVEIMTLDSQSTSAFREAYKWAGKFFFPTEENEAARVILALNGMVEIERSELSKAVNWVGKTIFPASYEYDTATAILAVNGTSEAKREELAKAVAWAETIFPASYEFATATAILAVNGTSEAKREELARAVTWAETIFPASYEFATATAILAVNGTSEAERERLASILTTSGYYEFATAKAISAAGNFKELGGKFSFPDAAMLGLFLNRDFPRLPEIVKGLTVGQVETFYGSLYDVIDMDLSGFSLHDALVDFGSFKPSMLVDAIRDIINNQPAAFLSQTDFGNALRSKLPVIFSSEILTDSEKDGIIEAIKSRSFLSSIAIKAKELQADSAMTAFSVPDVLLELRSLVRFMNTSENLAKIGGEKAKEVLDKVEAGLQTFAVHYGKRDLTVGDWTDSMEAVHRILLSDEWTEIYVGAFKQGYQEPRNFYLKFLEFIFALERNIQWRWMTLSRNSIDNLLSDLKDLIQRERSGILQEESQVYQNYLNQLSLKILPGLSESFLESGKFTVTLDMFQVSAALTELRENLASPEFKTAAANYADRHPNSQARRIQSTAEAIESAVSNYTIKLNDAAMLGQVSLTDFGLSMADALRRHVSLRTEYYDDLTGKSGERAAAFAAMRLAFAKNDTDYLTPGDPFDEESSARNILVDAFRLYRQKNIYPYLQLALQHLGISKGQISLFQDADTGFYFPQVWSSDPANPHNVANGLLEKLAQVQRGEEKTLTAEVIQTSLYQLKDEEIPVINMQDLSSNFDIERFRYRPREFEEFIVKLGLVKSKDQQTAIQLLWQMFHAFTYEEEPVFSDPLTVYFLTDRFMKARKLILNALLYMKVNPMPLEKFGKRDSAVGDYWDLLSRPRSHGRIRSYFKKEEQYALDNYQRQQRAIELILSGHHDTKEILLRQFELLESEEHHRGYDELLETTFIGLLQADDLQRAADGHPDVSLIHFHGTPNEVSHKFAGELISGNLKNASLAAIQLAFTKSEPAILSRTAMDQKQAARSLLSSFGWSYIKQNKIILTLALDHLGAKPADIDNPRQKAAELLNKLEHDSQDTHEDRYGVNEQLRESFDVVQQALYQMNAQDLVEVNIQDLIAGYEKDSIANRTAASIQRFAIKLGLARTPEDKQEAIRVLKDLLDGGFYYEPRVNEKFRNRQYDHSADMIRRTVQLALHHLGAAFKLKTNSSSKTSAEYYRDLLNRPLTYTNSILDDKSKTATYSTRQKQTIELGLSGDPAARDILLEQLRRLENEPAVEGYYDLLISTFVALLYIDKKAVVDAGRPDAAMVAEIEFDDLVVALKGIEKVIQEDVTTTHMNDYVATRQQQLEQVQRMMQIINADNFKDHVTELFDQVRTMGFDLRYSLQNAKLERIKRLEYSASDTAKRVGDAVRFYDRLGIIESVQPPATGSRKNSYTIRFDDGNTASGISSDQITIVDSRDEALTADSFTRGGIDLNPTTMNMQIQRDGNGVPLPVNLQNLENLNIQGFQPVIINVVPITNLPLLLGLNTTSSDPIESSKDSLSVADRLVRNPT